MHAVVSSSSDTENQDFDYTSSSEDMVSVDSNRIKGLIKIVYYTGTTESRPNTKTGSKGKNQSPDGYKASTPKTLQSKGWE